MDVSSLVHQALNPDPHETCSFPPARRWKNPPRRRMSTIFEGKFILVI